VALWPRCSEHLGQRGLYLLTNETGISSRFFLGAITIVSDPKYLLFTLMLALMKLLGFNRPGKEPLSFVVLPLVLTFTFSKLQC